MINSSFSIAEQAGKDLYRKSNKHNNRLVLVSKFHGNFHIRKRIDKNQQA